MIQKKRKIVWWIEVPTILIISIQIIAALLFSQFLHTVQLLVTEVFVYSLISLISYYTYDEKAIFADPKIPVNYPRWDLSEEEKIHYYNQVFVWFGLIKLNLILLLFCINLIELTSIAEIYIFLSLVIFFVLMIIIIIRFIKNMLTAKGFKEIPAIDILKKYTIYFNPDDKRAVIDKPFGVGSTINLATSQGKLIIGVILGIPLFIFALLLIILAFSGKL